MLHAIVNARSGLYALVHWTNWFAPIFVVFRRASFRMEEAPDGEPSPFLPVQAAHKLASERP
jgi:hypothetical protein